MPKAPASVIWDHHSSYVSHLGSWCGPVRSAPRICANNYTGQLFMSRSCLDAGEQSSMKSRAWAPAVLSICMCLSGAVVAETDWDIASNGQPYSQVQFDVREGTWMSVDVSPDGQTLAFDLLGDVYTVAATGGEATPVQDGPAMQRSPSFSRDGSKFLYLSDASGSDNVWVSNLDGSAPRQITHETRDILTGPAWGP